MSFFPGWTKLLKLLMIISRKPKRLGIIGAVAAAIASAAAVNLVFRIAFVARGQPSRAGEWAYLVGAVVLIAAVVPMFYRYLGVSNRLIFCLVHPLVTVAFQYCSEVLAGKYAEFSGKPMVFIPINGLLPLFFDELDLLVFGMVGCFVTLGFCRLLWGRDVIEPAYYCRGCCYDLTGCEGSNCPECGRPFTIEELGVTLKELEDRRRTCGRIARPITREARRRI